MVLLGLFAGRCLTASGCLVAMDNCSWLMKGKKENGCLKVEKGEDGKEGMQRNKRAKILPFILNRGICVI